MNKLSPIKDLLTEDQSAMMSELIGEITQAWQDQTIWRTFVEANCSVLNDLKFPTKAAKYHQAKKEQLVMWENLLLTSFEYREAKIDLEEVESKLTTETDRFELKRLAVKKDRLNFSIEGMRLQARERLREIVMWSQIKADLDDGTFDTQNKNTDQLIGLTIRYCRELPEALRSKETGAAINIVGQATTLLKECDRLGLTEQLGPEARKARKMLRG